MKSLTKLLAAASAALLFAGCNTMNGDAPASQGQTLCVISMEDADGGPTAEFEGQTVSFCCNSCKKRWGKLDDGAKRAALAKLAAGGIGHRQRQPPRAFAHRLDPDVKQLAIGHGTPPKNSRGDLPAILLTPPQDPNFPRMELPQSLAMTRSIGDFYMQTYGVTWRPEVTSVNLAGELPLLARSCSRAPARR